MTYLVLAVHMNSRQLFPIESYERHISAAYAASLRKSTSHADVFLYAPEPRYWFSHTPSKIQSPTASWHACPESDVPAELKAIALLHN